MCGNTLSTRYCLEDIPYSLEAIRALGKVAGVPSPCIDAIITIGRVTLAGQITEGRTGKMLGIEGMSKEELLKYIMG